MFERDFVKKDKRYRKDLLHPEFVFRLLLMWDNTHTVGMTTDSEKVISDKQKSFGPGKRGI